VEQLALKLLRSIAHQPPGDRRLHRGRIIPVGAPEV